MISNYRERTLIEHAGYNRGFGAVISMIPDDGLGVLIMSNLDFRAAIPTLLALKFHILDSYIETN